MRNVVQLCLAANNYYSAHVNETTLFSFLALIAIALVWKWQIASLPEDIHSEKQTRWSTDKKNYYTRNSEFYQPAGADLQIAAIIKMGSKGEIVFILNKGSVKGLRPGCYAANLLV